MMGVYLVISHHYKEAITSRLFHTPQPGSTATSIRRETGFVCTSLDFAPNPVLREHSPTAKAFTSIDS